MEQCALRKDLRSGKDQTNLCQTSSAGQIPLYTHIQIRSLWPAEWAQSMMGPRSMVTLHAVQETEESTHKYSYWLRQPEVGKHFTIPSWLSLPSLHLSLSPQTSPPQKPQWKYPSYRPKHEKVYLVSAQVSGNARSFFLWSAFFCSSVGSEKATKSWSPLMSSCPRFQTPS